MGGMQPHASEVGQGLDTRKQREGLRESLVVNGLVELKERPARIESYWIEMKKQVRSR